MKCKCGHARADHVRGGGCRAIKRVEDKNTIYSTYPCPCDQYDARPIHPNQAVVRNRVEPGGLEDDYLSPDMRRRGYR